eukprot:294106-Prorocentrum_lima.AAC.1
MERGGALGGAQGTRSAVDNADSNLAHFSGSGGGQLFQLGSSLGGWLAGVPRMLCCGYPKG